MWRFPEIGVPLNHLFQEDFPYKPLILGIPPFMETIICVCLWRCGWTFLIVWSVSTCRLPRTPMSQMIHRVWREASNGHEYPSTSGSRFILQLWRMMVVHKDIRRPCSCLRIVHRIGSSCGSSRAESLDLLATGVSVNGQTQPLYNVYHLG